MNTYDGVSVAQALSGISGTRERQCVLPGAYIIPPDLVVDHTRDTGLHNRSALFW